LAIGVAICIAAPKVIYLGVRFASFVARLL